jgi:hypothetical protein
LERFLAKFVAKRLEEADTRPHGNQAAKHPVAKIDETSKALDGSPDSNHESNVRTIER